MKKGKLYLICPDCPIEPAIRNEFGQEAYFLTALGSVFDFSDFEATQALDRFIQQEMITEIIIVNDTHCTFIENTVCQENHYNTKAEQGLEELRQHHLERFTHLDTSQQQELLAKLNIHRQAYALYDVAYLGGKIDEGLIAVSGLLYDRPRTKFERVELAM